MRVYSGFQVSNYQFSRFEIKSVPRVSGVGRTNQPAWCLIHPVTQNGCNPLAGDLSSRKSAVDVSLKALHAFAAILGFETAYLCFDFVLQHFFSMLSCSLAYTACFAAAIETAGPSRRRSASFCVSASSSSGATTRLIKPRTEKARSRQLSPEVRVTSGTSTPCGSELIPSSP